MTQTQERRPVTTPEHQPGYSRRSSFFFDQLHDLESAAYDANPLSIWDCKAVTEELSAKLPTYKGPVNPAAFERWATKLVIKEAQRYQILDAILSQHGRVIHKAIKTRRWAWVRSTARWSTRICAGPWPTSSSQRHMTLQKRDGEAIHPALRSRRESRPPVLPQPQQPPPQAQPSAHRKRPALRIERGNDRGGTRLRADRPNGLSLKCRPDSLPRSRSLLK